MPGIENRDWLVKVTGDYATNFVLATRGSQENQYPSTTPHSTYHCDICILHIVKVIPILISERAQIRRYTLAWKMYYAPPYKGPISVEENQGILDLEDV